MKALSILVLLALTALASATQVQTTPYSSIYAWLFNQVLVTNLAVVYLTCLYGTWLNAFLWNDGGYALYLCLSLGGVSNTILTLDA